MIKYNNTHVGPEYLAQSMAHRWYSIEATIVIDIIKCISKLRVTVSDNYHNPPQNPVLVTCEVNLTFLFLHISKKKKERFHFFNCLVPSLQYRKM